MKKIYKSISLHISADHSCHLYTIEFIFLFTRVPFFPGLKIRQKRIFQHHDSHDKRKKFVILKEKARSTYDVEFTHSSGWFKQSKNHYSLHNVKLSDKSVGDNVRAAEEFWGTLNEMIFMENYFSQQIFNMDETNA